MFIIIVALRIDSLVIASQIEFTPTSENFSNFQALAFIMSYEQDLFGFFSIICWLRLLKYLRLPEFSGPVVQSVIDTITEPTVLVFFAIILYVLFSFSVGFNLAFGPEVKEFSFFGTCLYEYF